MLCGWSNHYKQEQSLHSNIQMGPPTMTAQYLSSTKNYIPIKKLGGWLRWGKASKPGAAQEYRILQASVRISSTKSWLHLGRRPRGASVFLRLRDARGPVQLGGEQHAREWVRAKPSWEICVPEWFRRQQCYVTWVTQGSPACERHQKSIVLRGNSTASEAFSKHYTLSPLQSHINV